MANILRISYLILYHEIFYAIMHTIKLDKSYFNQTKENTSLSVAKAPYLKASKLPKDLLYLDSLLRKKYRNTDRDSLKTVFI